MCFSMQNFKLVGTEELQFNFMKNLFDFCKDIEELEYADTPNYGRLKNYLMESENLLNVSLAVTAE